MDFYLSGDVAPGGRFAFRFTTDEISHETGGLWFSRTGCCRHRGCGCSSGLRCNYDSHCGKTEESRKTERIKSERLLSIGAVGFLIER